MSVVTIHKAKTNLSRLIKKASAGEEVRIARIDKGV
jgi:antitoxin (DNA-binding transcriptional repressor) of toxin-antitoxin stability system